MMPRTADYRIVWIFGLIVGPAILVGIELFHPAGFTQNPGMFTFLRQPEPGGHSHSALDYFGPDWWFWLHMIQTPTVCLTAIALMLTVSTVQSEAAPNAAVTALSWGAHGALFVFAVYYTALDAIGGIGLGRTLEITNNLQAATAYFEGGSIIQCMDAAGNSAPCLSSEQVDGVALVLNETWTDPWVGGVGSYISQTGSWAIFIATVLTALTILTARAFRTSTVSWLAIVCLVAGGWFVQESHACCTGPLGFGLICLFGCLGWWESGDSAAHQTVDAEKQP